MFIQAWPWGGEGGQLHLHPIFSCCLLKLRIKRFDKLLQEVLAGPLSGRAESGQRPLGGVLAQTHVKGLLEAAALQ